GPEVDRERARPAGGAVLPASAGAVARRGEAGVVQAERQRQATEPGHNLRRPARARRFQGAAQAVDLLSAASGNTLRAATAAPKRPKTHGASSSSTAGPD